MNARKLILTIIKQVERIDPTLFVYGYQTANESRTHIWWEISVSNFEFYIHNETFLKIVKQWHNITKGKGINVIFVCGGKPTEERLVKLMNENNLILNIE